MWCGALGRAVSPCDCGCRRCGGIFLYEELLWTPCHSDPWRVYVGGVRRGWNLLSSHRRNTDLLTRPVTACVLTLVAFILSCDPAHVPARGGAGGDCRTGVRGHTRALCTLDRLERGTGWTAQGTGSRDTGHKVRTATRTIRRDIYLCRTSHHETDTFSHTQRAERQAAGHRTPVTAPHESNTQRTPTGRQRRRGTAKHTSTAQHVTSTYYLAAAPGARYPTLTLPLPSEVLLFQSSTFAHTP